MNARQPCFKQSPGHFCSAHQYSSVSAQEDKAAPSSPLHPSDQCNEQAESLVTCCALQSRWQDGLISSFTLKMPTNIWHEPSFLAIHMNLQEKINQKTHTLSIFLSHLNTDLLSDASSAPVWLQCIPTKEFFLGKNMVSSSAVEMRIAITFFQLFKMKNKRDTKVTAVTAHCCKVLKIAANKKMSEKLKADGWLAVQHGALNPAGEASSVLYLANTHTHTHTPTNLRGTAGLADLFGGFAVPDTPLPTRFGIPPEPDTIWYTLGVAEKVCHERGRVWPLLCGWHFERCRLPPTKGLHHFRAPRAMRLCPDQMTLA